MKKMRRKCRNVQKCGREGSAKIKKMRRMPRNVVGKGVLEGNKTWEQ